MFVEGNRFFDAGSFFIRGCLSLNFDRQTHILGGYFELALLYEGRGQCIFMSQSKISKVFGIVNAEAFIEKCKRGMGRFT